MKKSIVIIALALSIVSCNKTIEVKEAKTAYVDTSKLLEQNNEAKEIDAKYKAKQVEMGKELEAEIAKFKTDAAYFKSNAQAKGQAWAQEHGSALQKREQQLSYAQQAMIQQLQQESGVEMDTLVVHVKKFIKSYGKEKGYSYIFGTGEAASILYAEDKYDITKEIIKLVNDKHTSEGSKPAVTADPQAEAKK
ncbi:MAG TPA: OmpH family outer membrane protein [Flavobacterium sp.]|nr:OmpH family outer membrane protein [Flavobacterium sp.]